MPAALLVSIRVPQAIGASALAILQICDRIINFVDFGLLAELAVCADLAMATVRCSIYCVRVNVRDLSDEADRRSIEGTASQLLSHGAELIQRVSPRIWARDSQGV
jgi:formiminotetrahydrofolate cyclodeaminase